MKIQIDTKAKEITIEESVNLDELFKMVKVLLPNNTWKEYKLKSQIINNWSYPIIYREWHNPIFPWQPNIIYSTGSSDMAVDSNTIISQKQDHFVTGLSTQGCQTVYNVEF